MNKGGFIHPRMFAYLDAMTNLWDQQVQLEDVIEEFDAVNQPVYSYAPAADPSGLIDCRVGVMTAEAMRSVEDRYPAMTISTDTRYIALKGYYPQITKGMRANVVGGQAWNITGTIDDTTHTQTYLLVEEVRT